MYPWSNKKNDLRCPVCLHDFSSAELRVTNPDGILCPRCHNEVRMRLVTEDGYIRMNWEDLRLLCIYAERWASQFDLTNKGNQAMVIILGNIIRQLNKSKPAGSLFLTNPDDPVVIANSKKVANLGTIARFKPPRDKPNGIRSPYYQKDPPTPPPAI